MCRHNLRRPISRYYQGAVQELQTHLVLANTRKESLPNTYLQLSAAPPCIAFRRSLSRVAGAVYKHSGNFRFSTHWVVVVVVVVVVVMVVVVVVLVVLVVGWRLGWWCW